MSTAYKGFPFEGKLSAKPTDEVFMRNGILNARHFIRRCAPPSPQRGMLVCGPRMHFYACDGACVMDAQFSYIAKRNKALKLVNQQRT
jgi:hypothetical protein